ncbi:hypothetical protein [Methylobacterium nodulans]|uniref:hypothetical protein n=1 Tax=Methylobacterium nodulans TaxID=114616 RepID=UPI0012EE2385|nr:hypothetical protein [Methylobacterium nodulans]
MDRVSSALGPRVEVVGQYSGLHSLIDVSCRDCGHRWRPYAGNLLNGRANCKPCFDRSRRLPAAEVVAEIEAALSGAVEVVGEYRGAKHRLPVRCRVCDHRWAPVARYSGPATAARVAPAS